MIELRDYAVKYWEEVLATETPLTEKEKARHKDLKSKSRSI